MTIEEKLKRLGELRDRVTIARLDRDEQVTLVMAPVQAQVDAINLGFEQVVECDVHKIAELEDEIRREVIALGKTVKAGGIQAVYLSGRVAWDAKALDGYALGHPELFAFRKQGEPSVSIRVTGKGE